jgi:putative nucleotidyltransferase with HDIG domain
MSDSPGPSNPGALSAYVAIVAALGAVVVSISTVELVNQPADFRVQWFSLVALTIVSGLIPVTLPNVSISISISETFVIAGTLLFGPAGGSVLILLDALFMSLRLRFSRRIQWKQIIFNASAGPLAVWVAAHTAGITPLFETDPAVSKLDFWFVGKLAVFTTIYFFLISWLLTIAIALQRQLRPYELWTKYCRDLLVNYGAGGSIGALLVYNTRTVDPIFVAAIIPLLILLFLAYQWSNKRVEAERQKVTELNRVFLSTIEALALAIDAKDQVTHGHIRRVQRYTMTLADALGIKDSRQLDALRAAALLHDTGKLAVPEYILNKPGPLTPAEFERMKVHAAVGADILKSINFPYPVEPIVRHHHENWNGSGYPDGLRAHDIPLGARILSVVDCYDALTSDRPYRPRYSRQHAEQVLRERRGTWYDPWVVDEFLRILDRLEKMDADETLVTPGTEARVLSPSQLDVIAATTAEEREFNELRRDLPLTASATDAADVLFRHLRRVIPAANLTLFIPNDKNELAVVASSGVGTSAIEGLTIPVGDRISGWALAHKQAVLNSNAALELGPVARTFSVPLRYGLAVPILNGPVSTPIGVITAYGSDPFNNDHKRVMESAATLFAAAVAPAAQKEARPDSRPADRPGPRVH